MAMQFSFEYCIVTEVHKTDDWMLEQGACSMVYLNCQYMRSDSSNRLNSLAGPGLKMEEEHLNIEIFPALLICNTQALVCDEHLLKNL